ncbi:hypothetical protein D9M68_883360 [compost metagenome]
MVASRQNERVIFNYERRALNNPDFTTSKALMMLWRQELLDVSERMGVRQKKAGNRSDFAKLLSEHVNKEDALEQIQGAILQRFSALLPHT